LYQRHIASFTFYLHLFPSIVPIAIHIFVIWVPSKNRLIQSRDVQFREEIKHLPEESINEIKEIEEENTYHVIILNKIHEAEQELNQKPVDSEGKLSADPTGYRYMTPQSIDHSDEVEEPDREWYPDDIDPEAPDLEVPDPTRNETVPKEQENKSSEPVVVQHEIEKKTEQVHLRKGKEPQEATQTSTRANKGQRSDTFTKEHYITYVNFVAAQIVK
jgi:hypothetical protein